jgi:hypothetical protein
MKSKNLPCPFCGHKPKFKRIPREIAMPEIPNAYWSIECCNHNCAALPICFGDTKAEAATSWNHRAH